MDNETLSSILFIIRLGVVTIVLWVASRLFDLVMDLRRRSADRDAFIRAIYAEVDFNTFDMKRFLDATIPLSRLAVLFENKDFVPHITDARHTDVYRSRIDELHSVVEDAASDGSLVGDLVRFYGELEKVVQQIEGLGKPSFKLISGPGKVATIGNIYKTCAYCESIGVRILGKMEAQFAHLKLHRNDTKQHSVTDATQDIEDLREALRALGLNLDRVDHNKQ